MTGRAIAMKQIMELEEGFGIMGSLSAFAVSADFFLENGNEIVYGHEMPSDGAVSLIQGWPRHEESYPNCCIPKITGSVLRQEGIDLFKEYVARHSSGAMWEWAKTVAAL